MPPKEAGLLQNRIFKSLLGKSRGKLPRTAIYHNFFNELISRFGPKLRLQQALFPFLGSEEVYLQNVFPPCVKRR